MKLFKKIWLSIALLVLLGCAASPTPVVPWPDFRLIEIGDMLCAPTEADRIKFDRWLGDMDKYLKDTGAL